MSSSEHHSAGSESVDVKGPPTPWQEMGYVAWFLSFLVALLTFGGVAIVGTAIAPDDSAAP